MPDMKFTDDETLKLISLVRSHANLYNRRNSAYRNKHRTMAAWQKIGEELGVPGATALSKWRSVRTSYTRQLKQAADTKHLGALPGERWPYMGPMSWLKDYIQEKPPYPESPAAAPAPAPAPATVRLVPAGAAGADMKGQPFKLVTVVSAAQAVSLPLPMAAAGRAETGESLGRPILPALPLAAATSSIAGQRTALATFSASQPPPLVATRVRATNAAAALAAVAAAAAPPPPPPPLPATVVVKQPPLSPESIHEAEDEEMHEPQVELNESPPASPGYSGGDGSGRKRRATDGCGDTGEDVTAIFESIHSAVEALTQLQDQVLARPRLDGSDGALISLLEHCFRECSDDELKKEAFADVLKIVMKLQNIN